MGTNTTSDGRHSLAPPMLRARMLDHPAVVHGFTTREGGVSEPPFDTLNLTSGRGDDERNVETNRTRVRRVLGLGSVAFARQVHGRAVLRVDPADGRDDAPVHLLGEADALVTDRPGIGLVAQTADCVPVLLFDPVRPAVAAVHSGWRGAVKNVAEAAVGALTHHYGSKPHDLFAAIGPAISKARYRVGPEVLDAFRARFGDLDGGLIGPLDGGGGATLDVGEAVRRQLVEAGLRGDRIERLPYCTFDDDRFFSSRRAGGGAFGGQAGVIGLVGT